jgi:uncharacterized phage protein (TIGR01671 family)
MREILFRAKRKDTGEWVEGFYFESFTEIPYIMTLHDHILGMTEFYEVDPATVGQFTGLLDKNGKRIFEGDILQVYNYKCVVKFGMHEACNGWYAESDGGIVGELNNSFEIAEIIGTIHDEVTP